MKNQSEVFDHPIIINESHLDTFGHINNAAYLTLFEIARWEFVTNHGFGLKEVHERKQGPVILEINLQFKKEIRNREKIIIRSTCHPFVGKIAKIDQRMIKENGEEACLALFTFGFFDLKARKLIDPTPEWLKAIGLT